jgi:hypothetical protein
LHGEHVAKDSVKAAGYFKSACDNGSGDGCYALAMTLDVRTQKPKADALMERGCELRGAYACSEVANRAEGCCGFGALMRACQAGLRQACVSAGVHIGKPVVPAYLRACRGDKFSACSYLEKDISLYDALPSAPSQP